MSHPETEHLGQMCCHQNSGEDTSLVPLGCTSPGTLRKAQASDKGLYLGIDALYQLEIAQKWDFVANIPSITIIPLTIARLMELYKGTGVAVFYRVIEHLATMKNVIIQSPDLKLYLAMDMKYPELPPHYKMEQALMVQEATHIF